MQHLRDLLRSSLRKSLEALSPLDRVAAAWPVAAGHAIAERSSVARLEARQGQTVAIVVVTDAAWLRQMRELTPQLRGDLGRVSGVPLTDILFELPQTGAASGTHGSRTGP